MKIPKFNTEEEEVEFWDTHSLDEFNEDLTLAEDVTFKKSRKKLVSLRLDSQQIEILKKIATGKGIGYLTLVRMWITEKLKEEIRNKIKEG
ncbi:MAG: CopG family antitoxin [Candidatus Eremiobacterota bacterium]